MAPGEWCKAESVRRKPIVWWLGLAMLAGSVAGCAAEGREIRFARHLMPAASLDALPGTLEVKEPARGGTNISMGNLLIELPPGWSARIYKDFPCEETSQFRHGWGATLSAKRGEGSLVLNLAYMEGRAYVPNPQPDAQEILAIGTDRPQAFLERYLTDLELFTAAFAVTRQDYTCAVGADRSRIRALLCFKYYILLRKAVRFTSPKLVNFISPSNTECGIEADLFSREGNYAGRLHIEFTDRTSLDERRTVTAQLLYHACVVKSASSGSKPQ